MLQRVIVEKLMRLVNARVMRESERAQENRCSLMAEIVTSDVREAMSNTLFHQISGCGLTLVIIADVRAWTNSYCSMKKSPDTEKV